MAIVLKWFSHKVYERRFKYKIDFMEHKSHKEILDEFDQAKMVIKIGGIYAHYKNPQHMYKVLSLGTIESTDKLCVIYQEIDGDKLIFVRELDSWLEEPNKGVLRFKLIK